MSDAFSQVELVSAEHDRADSQCWFHEPRAVAADGKVWFGTCGATGGVRAAGSARLHQLVEATGDTSHYDFISGPDWADDHNYPVVLIRPDGRLVAFYCAHRLPAPIRYRISIDPHSAAAWSREYTIDVAETRPTYPSPFMLTGEGNRVYVFFRNGRTASLSVVISDDLATLETGSGEGSALASVPKWGEAISLVTGAGRQGVYAKICSNGSDRIDVCLTDALGDTARPKLDVRHGYYTGGFWYGSGGAPLGHVGKVTPFGSFTPVATSGEPDFMGDLWVWDVVRRATGVIECVFVRLISGSDHRYYYARWNGTSWFRAEIGSHPGSNAPDSRSSQITNGFGAVEAYYSPGLYLDRIEEGLVYCSVGGNLSSVIYRYRTHDGGSSWSRERVSDTPGQNIRPFVPANRSDKVQVLWAGAGHYAFYDFRPNVESGYSTRIFAEWQSPARSRAANSAD